MAWSRRSRTISTPMPTAAQTTGADAAEGERDGQREQRGPRREQVPGRRVDERHLDLHRHAEDQREEPVRGGRPASHGPPTLVQRRHPVHRAQRKRRSRSALATTETLESAIAAPAITGLRKPAAASGSAATL